MDQVAQADVELRRNGLGDMAVLHDHLISYITFLLDLEDVVRLSCCSRILHVFACEEPLWLGLCLKLHEGVVEYKANWRQTALATYSAKAVPPEAVEAAGRPLPPLPGLSSLFLYKRWYRCHVDLTSFLPPPGAATMDRVDAAAMSPGEFVRQYDRPGLPVLLGGLTDGWPVSAWSLPALSASFPSALFKVSKPHGGRALMTLPAYVDYMARQADEEPLYVFDATFAESAPGMRKLYDVPHVFAQDYYSELQGARPHYRWLVLGPARSGASWHVDPALTSAWNALLSGRKRWALYPPHVRPPGVVLDDDGNGEEAHPADDCLTSLQWFLEVYPALPPELRPIELLQNPGDVVFVPGGWWHCVLNLETSVAVTQNYVGEANLGRVVRYMADGSAAYHQHPLSYYDPRVEAATWVDKYPHLPIQDQDQDSDQEEGEGEEGEGEEEVGLAAAEEQQRQQQQQASQRRQRRRQPQRQRQRQADAVAGQEGVGPGLDEGGAKAAKRARREEQPPAPIRAEAENGHVVRGLYFRSLVGGAGGGGRVGQVTSSDAGDVDVDGGAGAGAGAGGGGGSGDLSSRSGQVVEGVGRSSGNVCGGGAAAANGQLAARLDSGGHDGGGGEDISDGEVWAGLGVLWPGELEYAEVAVWRRERILGRWLRRLWLSQPATRPVIQDCLFKHLHGGFWREVLRVIARQQSSRVGAGGSAAATADGANGSVGVISMSDSSGGGSGVGISSGGCLQPLEPTALELIPLMGADAIVFLYGSTAIKIFAHEVPAMRGLMCALEARVPQLLLPRKTAATNQPFAEAAAAAADGGAAAATRAGAAAASDLAVAAVPAAPAAAAAAAGHLPLPQPLAWGAVAAALTPRSRCQSRGEASGEDGQEEEGEPGPPPPQQQQQHLLYVVQQQLQGSLVLQELLDQDTDPERGQEQGQALALARHKLTAVAEALGDLLGAMHATAAADAADAAAAAAPAPEAPLPAAAPQSVEEWDAVVRHRAVWHDRSHSIWVSELGCVSSAPDTDDDADDDEAVGASPAPAAAPAAPAMTAAPAAPAMTAGGGAGASADPGAGANVAAAACGASRSGAAGAKGNASAWPCEVPLKSRWWPFVQHLRQRRRRLLRDLPGLSLPAWVKDQLPAYLPEDPAQLLGFRPAAAGAAAEAAAEASGTSSVAAACVAASDGPGVPPLLLHGDVTAHNVIISQQQQQQQQRPPSPPQGPGFLGTVADDAALNAAAAAAGAGGATAAGSSRGAGGDADGGSDGGGGGVAGCWRPQLSLVDFSDGGHGDPLYELLPVLGSCLRCDAAAAARFWDSYRAHVDPRAAWPRRRLQAPSAPPPRDGDGTEELQLSYCAMCYCLLHEEAELLLDRVWKATEEPAAAAAAATAATAAAVAVPQRTLAGLAVRLWGFLDEGREGREGNGGGAAAGGEGR
ncbi:hypothetical protein PLESTB_000529500 [Pleodorina starrii]|uniref:JmjC domain-containing protein n=1 Tax=Pleodorina starrii TaxID=330485 RepID=A0A9W6F0U3_9CHLO|nr:hypothetical protein PLESTM_000392900 [Pleodorina starrii]GLC51690.1 hypothetical protein PLESTB_000529500 [Pleodorina starrii]